MLDEALVIVLAGGAGERLSSADAGPREAGRLLRRPLPHHRLRRSATASTRGCGASSSPRSTSRSRSTATSAWAGASSSEELGEFIEILPPQKRVGENWYLGTADAVYQNFYSIMPREPAPGHRPRRATTSTRWTTPGCCASTRSAARRSRSPTIEVPIEEATAVRHRRRSTKRDRVIGFQEKPKNPLADPRVAAPGAGLDGHLRLRGRTC